MVAPIIASYSGSAGCPTTTGITVPAPIGIQENELLIADINCKFGFGGNLIAPSGWNLIFSLGSDPAGIDLWYKITDTSDTIASGYDFSSSSSKSAFRGYIYRISGSDISNPFLASGSETRYSNQTYNDRLDLSMGDSLLFAVHGHRGGTWGIDVINYNGWSLLTSFDCGGSQAEKSTFSNVFENAGKSNTPEIDLLETFSWTSAVVAIKPAIEPPSWGIQNSVVVSKNVILKG